MDQKKDITILGIESSCDETAAAVVVNGRKVLSNEISSQIDIHTLYGGVVPEIASRKHTERINQVIRAAMETAGKSFDDLDAIAVTCGPGLVGALLIGVSAAKGLAFGTGKTLIGVHHIEGHISANFIAAPELTPPFICLVVSGGHTHLVLVRDYGEYVILGRTRDDAAGEAFDKVARAIGLGYPGGPKIDKAAKEGNPHAIEFPRGKVAGSEYDFTFSGIKSSVLNYLNRMDMKGEKINVNDVAASFQQAVVDVLVGHAMAAVENINNGNFDGIPDGPMRKPIDKTADSGAVGKMASAGGTASDRRDGNVNANGESTADLLRRTLARKKITKFALAGGVASNSALRAQMKEACEKRGLSFYCPPPILCTDNAAMIGCAAYYEFLKGRRSGYDLNAMPNLRLGESVYEQ